MTIVVTTASRNGISVVGDQAVSHRTGQEAPTVIGAKAQKVYYSKNANMALACWGSTDLGGESYADWLSSWVENRLAYASSLDDAGTELANELNAVLQPLAAQHGGWGTLHRGIHLSGYNRDLPCIYHVHTGSRATGFHPLRVHRDFPDVHGGGEDSYRQHIEQGYRAQIFNGFHELFGAVGKWVGPLRAELEAEFEVTIPAPTLRGQLEMDRAVVQFSAGLLRAGDRAPQVSAEINDVAFTVAGLADFIETSPMFPPLRPRSTDLRAPVTESVSHTDSH